MSLSVADLTFYYSDIYLSEHVNCVLAMEAYLDKDLDASYNKYLIDYLQSITSATEENLSKEDFIQKMKNNAQAKIASTYEWLKKNLNSKIHKSYPPNVDRIEKIATRLKTKENPEKFNFEYLNEVLLIEEEIFENGGKL